MILYVLYTKDYVQLAIAPREPPEDRGPNRELPRHQEAHARHQTQSRTKPHV